MKRKMKAKQQEQPPENTDETSEEEETEDEEVSEEEESGEDEEENIKEEDVVTMATTKNGDGDGPPAKMARLSKTQLYKPPTNEELNELKETENLFQSSLFRMQISELIGEVMIKDKRKKQIDQYLHKLKDTLTKLPTLPEKELKDDIWLKKKNIVVPFKARSVQKGKFQFLPPRSVKVVGSYLLGTCIKPNPHVDIAVEIPKECIQAKDHLNCRYLTKRALYLSCLALKMKKSDIVEDIRFTYHHGNHMKPILLIKPAGNIGKFFCVRIHTCVEEGSFKLNRFHIGKNNIRKEWYNGKKPAEESSQEECNQPATPHYNMTVLEDLVMQRHLEELHDIIKDSTGLKEGIALLKVWLHQRELDLGSGSMSGFILTMLVLYLVKTKKLNRGMSSYQVLRNTLIHLGHCDWSSQGISVAGDGADSHRPGVEEFYQSAPLVFVDSSGYINLVSAMTTATFSRVKHEARLSIQHLETPGVDGFQMLFMTSMPFIRTFDQAFHISQLSSLEQCVEKHGLGDRVMDLCGNYVEASIPTIIDLLKRALDKRLHLLAVRLTKPPEWAVTEAMPSIGSGENISFGILLDTEYSNSILDKGPPADSPQAGDFREFWGAASELRRFQDGSICEAVVWQGKTQSDKRTVVSKIVKHTLNRHCSIDKEAVSFVGSELDRLLRVVQGRKKGVVYGTGEEHHLDIMRSYDDLSKQLRNMKDFPLAVHSIQGTSSAFRFAQVFPAMPAEMPCDAVCTYSKRRLPEPASPCPPFTPTLKVQCILEASGKWPDDAPAVQRLKAAFHKKLGQQIQKEYSLLSHIHPQHVDVLKDGYVFRVQIGYIKEISLLKMVTSPDGIMKVTDTEESISMERELVTIPKLASTLHSIQQQYPNYCTAVRLAKRWLSAQMLSSYYLRDEAVELLMAYIFLHPAPYSPPCNPQVGFLRFLNLLSAHDWKLQPIIVDLNQELTREDYADIQMRFNKDRPTLPLMFIATPQDKFESVWTKGQPSAQILQRTVLLAHESLQVLQAQLLNTGRDTDFKQIFRPPLDIYDVLIHLKPQQVPRQCQAVDCIEGAIIPKYVDKDKMPSGDEKKLLPVVNFDCPQMFLRELRDTFDDVALFFHDTYGGSVITVLWKPAALQPTPFKVSHLSCRKVDTESDSRNIQTLLNIEAILEDFKVMGKGLVLSVENKRKIDS